MAATYSTGTVSVALNGTAVTGVGTAWTTSGLRAGDLFNCRGYSVPILSINSATSLTLAYGFPVAVAAGTVYHGVYQDDITRSLATQNQLLQSLVGGNLEAFAGLTGAANLLPYFVSGGAMGTTVLSAFARTLLDDTNGAAMRATIGVSDFGLGTTTVSFPGGDLSVIDNSVATGLYQYNPGAMSGGPIAAWGSVLHMRRASGGGETQIFVSETTPTGLWVRSRGTGAWNAWGRAYSTQNVLAAVAMSDGVPTGGLFQRISNANGEAIRFADGTQICWAEVTAARISNYACRIYRDFPAVFANDQARITCTLLPTTGVGYATTPDERRYWGACGPSQIQPQGVSLDAYVSTGAPSIPAGATIKLHYQAIGRWFV